MLRDEFYSESQSRVNRKKKYIFLILIRESLFGYSVSGITCLPKQFSGLKYALCFYDSLVPGQNICSSKRLLFIRENKRQGKKKRRRKKRCCYNGSLLIYFPFALIRDLVDLISFKHLRQFYFSSFLVLLLVFRFLQSVIFFILFSFASFTLLASI